MASLLNYNRKVLGRCLEEYKHPQFNELLNECVGFQTVPIGTSPRGAKMRFEPKCEAQQSCYGILKNSDTKVLLWQIVDSSD